MGSPDISGGSLVIFEHALYLQSLGSDVTIVPLLEPVSNVKSRWHPALERLTFKSFSEIANSRFDIAIATWWKTVYELHRIDAAQFCYFVQSIESWFYPDDVAVRNLAHSTYLLGLPTITEATWIKDYLAAHFGTSAHLAQNGCNKAVYCEDGPAELPRINGHLRVLVEGPLGVDFKNVARTIALLRKTHADEIWLLTISPIKTYPGVHRVFSRVPAHDCPRIYRSCDVLVKFSYVEGMFGPPLEIFHCGGTAVVYDVTGHDEYIVHRENALVVPTGDEGAATAAVNELKREPALLARLKQGAQITAREWPDWAEASAEFHRALVNTLTAEPRFMREQLVILTREFWSQYVRTEEALRRGRPPSWFRRAGDSMTRGVKAIAQRSPAAARALAVMHARMFEERWRPTRRTRI
jgi:glycosyl transferase family 1